MYHIVGNISAANYLHITKGSGTGKKSLAGSTGLNLTGRFAYIELSARKGQAFAFHLDVLTADLSQVRLSFSNVFRDDRKEQQGRSKRRGKKDHGYKTLAGGNTVQIPLCVVAFVFL